MSSAAKDLTRGPLAPQILAFSVPLVLSNLLQVLFNMSDIAVVGRFGGPVALGSVGSTTVLVTLVTGFLIGLSGGINVLVARFFGAQHPKDVSETVHTGALVSLAAGLVLTVLGLLLVPTVLGMLGTKPELLPGAVLYLRIYLLGMPALALYNFGNAVFSAVGDTRRPLYYLSFAGVLNILLNLTFVIGFHLDVAGVALASILSQYVSAGLILRALVKSSGDFALRPAQLRLYPGKTQTLLALGIPAGCQNAIFALANLFIQSGINSFDTLTVQGHSAAANSDALVYDVMAAFYMACASFMSQNYGAGKPERVRRSYFISLGFSFGIGAVMGLSLVAFGRPFLSLFTTDPAVVEAGMQRLIIMGLSYPISAFMDCTIAASRGLGHTVVPTVLVILGSCVFRVIWVYTVFAYFHTVESLYLVFVCSWLVTALAETIYFVRCYRKQMAVFSAA